MRRFTAFILKHQTYLLGLLGWIIFVLWYSGYAQLPLYAQFR